MKSISDLALKGHFEELKNKFEKKGMAKAKSKDTLITALKKAVSTIEDLYDQYPGSFSESNRDNYRSLIKTLNDHGSSYMGHPELMDAEGSTEYTKKPMARAGKAKERKKNRKTG